MRTLLLAVISCSLVHDVCDATPLQVRGNGEVYDTTKNKRPDMKSTDFTTGFVVDQSPEAVFNAINNVRGWWSVNIKGATDSLHAEFLYGYKDVHVSKMRIIEWVPGKRVVWLVLENHFNFTKDSSEWKGNKIIFDIQEKGQQTELRFTQEGLVPAYECYPVCHDAWTSYIQGSLKQLVVTGTGNSNPEDGGLNAELVEKWGLPKK